MNYMFLQTIDGRLKERTDYYYNKKVAIKLKIIAATRSSCNKTCNTCTAVVQMQDSFIASFIACFILLVIAPLGAHVM